MARSLCAVEDCESKVRSNGLCNSHYFRLRRHGSLELPKTKREILVEQGQSHCPKCGLVKSIVEFSKDNATAFGVAIYCKSCNKQAGKLRYRDHKAKFQAYDLNKKFGLTVEQFQNLLDSQGGVCEICKSGFKPNKRPGVDHCHKTGKIRGILCDLCNKGIGHMRDSEEFLTAAAQYIRKSKEWPTDYPPILNAKRCI